ncbi:hypothetical protein UlMin_018286 [Ulmus minor]
MPYEKKLLFYATLSFHAGDALIQLYHNFITDFETKINLLKLAHFAVIVSRQYPDKEAAISYLEGVIEKLTVTREVQKSSRRWKEYIDNMTDIDLSVYANYYWVSSQYYKVHQEFAESYKSALLYLVYTSVDLVFSTLLRDNIYNFGELFAHPILMFVNQFSEILFAYDLEEQFSVYMVLMHNMHYSVQPFHLGPQKQLRVEKTTGPVTTRYDFSRQNARMLNLLPTHIYAWVNGLPTLKCMM